VSGGASQARNDRPRRARETGRRDERRPRDERAATRDRARFGVVLGLVALGGAATLLVSGRAWQTLTVPRPRPFADEIVDVSGRTLEPAGAALGIVALAGVVAVLATQGIARRAVGGLLAGAAVGLAWTAIAGLRPVSAARARSLIADARRDTGVDTARPLQVTGHSAWAMLALACALTVLVAGVAIMLWGHRWGALSKRYEAPAVRAGDDGGRSPALLWNDLDRGRDPTSERPAGT
jgi:uncharacterized membrane protein (TIGR02234 family)